MKGVLRFPRGGYTEEENGLVVFRRIYYSERGTKFAERQPGASFFSIGRAQKNAGSQQADPGKGKPVGA